MVIRERAVDEGQRPRIVDAADTYRPGTKYRSFKSVGQDKAAERGRCTAFYIEKRDFAIAITITVARNRDVRCAIIIKIAVDGQVAARSDGQRAAQNDRTAIQRGIKRDRAASANQRQRLAQREIARAEIAVVFVSEGVDHEIGSAIARQQDIIERNVFVARIEILDCQANIEGRTKAHSAGKLREGIGDGRAIANAIEIRIDRRCFVVTDGIVTLDREEILKPAAVDLNLDPDRRVEIPILVAIRRRIFGKQRRKLKIVHPGNVDSGPIQRDDIGWGEGAVGILRTKEARALLVGIDHVKRQARSRIDATVIIFACDVREIVRKIGRIGDGRVFEVLEQNNSHTQYLPIFGSEAKTRCLNRQWSAFVLRGRPEDRRLMSHSIPVTSFRVMGRLGILDLVPVVRCGCAVDVSVDPQDVSGDPQNVSGCSGARREASHVPHDAAAGQDAPPRAR